MIVAGLLWTDKLRSDADALLGLFVGCIASHMAIKFVIYNFIADEEIRHQMNTFLGLCYGPLFYLYTLKIADQTFMPISRWYVFIPFLFGTIAYFTVAGVIYFSRSSGYPLLHGYNLVSSWAILFLNVYFAIASLQVRKNYVDKIKASESKMIKMIAAYFMAISALPAPVYIYQYFDGNDAGVPLFLRTFSYAALCLLCVLIIYFRYVAIQIPASKTLSPQADLIVTDLSISETLAGNSVLQTEPFNRKSSLSEERMEEIWKALEEYTQVKRCFSDSDLNLDKLAEATRINKYHISETLNSFDGKSFYQYINEYRIHHAIGQMESLCKADEDINFMSIAYAAGFKAKSSFNRYFKEITGTTPTEHLRSVQAFTESNSYS
jgi:AraC-like DNA-binding protein